MAVPVALWHMDRMHEHRSAFVGDRIVREAECRALTGLSRTTRWRLERAGGFPRRLRLSKNTVGWRFAELAEWIASRQRASRDEAERGQ